VLSIIISIDGSTAELVDQICHVLIRAALQSQTIPTVRLLYPQSKTFPVSFLPTLLRSSSFLSATHRSSTATVALFASVVLKVCPAVCLCFCCYGVPIATDRGIIRSTCAGDFLRAWIFVRTWIAS
jgi:hypothetical protein